eukprot:1736936-Lingulodinium_polyedra.AAC.1
MGNEQPPLPGQLILLQHSASPGLPRVGPSVPLGVEANGLQSGQCCEDLGTGLEGLLEAFACRVQVESHDLLWGLDGAGVV